MKRYVNIWDLLSDYLAFSEMTQQTLADLVTVDVKTVHRWKTGKAVPNHQNISNMSMSLAIPVDVLHSLNTERPIFYDIRTRKFAHSEYDTELINSKSLEQAIHKKSLDQDIYPLYSESYIDKSYIDIIVEYDRLIYPNENNAVDGLVIERAAKYHQDINFIIMDSKKYHYGHLVCLPIPIELHDALCSRRILERDIQPSDIIDHLSNRMMDLHIYCMYASSSHMALKIIRRAARSLALALKQDRLSPNSHIAAYAVTKDGVDICNKLGLYSIFENPEEETSLNLDTTPIFFSGRICTLSFFRHLLRP